VFGENGRNEEEMVIALRRLSEMSDHNHEKYQSGQTASEKEL
jgi:hypothetical protein